MRHLTRYCSTELLLHVACTRVQGGFTGGRRIVSFTHFSVLEALSHRQRDTWAVPGSAAVHQGAGH